MHLFSLRGKARLSKENSASLPSPQEKLCRVSSRTKRAGVHFHFPLARRPASGCPAQPQREGRCGLPAGSGGRGCTGPRQTRPGHASLWRQCLQAWVSWPVGKALRRQTAGLTGACTWACWPHTAHFWARHGPILPSAPSVDRLDPRREGG